MIHDDYIAEDGSVTDRTWETYYSELKGVHDNPTGQYLRVVMDHGAYDVETRIPHSMLEALGWKQESIVFA